MRPHRNATMFREMRLGRAKPVVAMNTAAMAKATAAYL